MLRDLIGKVSSEAERLFLSEAIKCYHTLSMVRRDVGTTPAGQRPNGQNNVDYRRGRAFYAPNRFRASNRYAHSLPGAFIPASINSTLRFCTCSAPILPDTARRHT